MRAVSRNRLVTAWTSFLTTSAIFMLIGFLIFGIPPWWCWFVPALTLVEAVRSTIQYLAGENTRICPNCNQKTSISNQFCHQCGYDLRAVTYQNYGKVESAEPELAEEPKYTPQASSRKYCVTCGGPLEGTEEYCPTCGMPLNK